MNAQEVKEALNARAEEFTRWLFPAGRKNGREWQVGSLSGEAGKSLSISIEGAKAGVFKDFATNEAGDNFVELYAQAKQVSFTQALHATAEWLGSSVTRPDRPVTDSRRSATHPAITRAQLPVEIHSPTDDECAAAVRMAERLSGDSALWELIANSRKWKPDTIRNLALEGYLGWNEGKLSFIYDTGVKLRWRDNGERIIRWAFGKPWIWRGSWLNSARTVYLSESETDAIALIDAGFEDEAGVIVVAMPSASTFKPDWAYLFTGKDVVLVFDNDAAGVKATQTVSTLLRNHARSVNRLDWEGVQHAAQG